LGYGIFGNAKSYLDRTENFRNASPKIFEFSVQELFKPGMTVRLYNTVTRSVEDFVPLDPTTVTMYTCGPTVYNYAHIGNLRAYVFADVLRRTLEANGYTVKHVTNITDVGHLVSDGDDGEDKMVVGAKREGKSVEEIIALYSDAFYKDLEALNIEKASLYPRATHYINEQKKLIETLFEKGFTYTTTDGIYFDTSKFPRYADFARLDIAGLREGARIEANTEKRNSTDFALWKFSPEDGVKREQEWGSPLVPDRKGFPGWHVECSAIAMKELGETIDIHTGGIDHIPVHHTNEIAQSESATGKQFVRIFMHSAHMMVDGQKMSKSLGNTYRLTDLYEKWRVPSPVFRYWLLTASYRTTINFTREGVDGAHKALIGLCAAFEKLVRQKPEESNAIYIEKFMSFINDDLNTPKCIALLHELVHDDTLSSSVKHGTFLKINEVLGLDLVQMINVITRRTSALTPPDVQKLLDLRETSRKEKNYAESDRLRDEIHKLGYEVKDTPDGQQLESL
jgi:cysteinyl-tRNA synthetase